MWTLQLFKKQGLLMSDLFKKDSTLSSKKDSKLGKERAKKRHDYTAWVCSKDISPSCDENPLLKGPKDC